MLSLRATHDVLPTSHLRMVQVLVTAWLFTGQSLLWPGPHPLWSGALAALSTTLCLGVLFSPFTRACSFALAALIGLELATQPTWFAHNRLFVAALLLMVSLSSTRFAALPRLQVALVYAVAAFDKLLEPAWRDGRFFESFIAQLARFGLMWAPGGTVGAPNPLAVWLESVGHRPAWMLLGLSVIALELFLAACFLGSLRFGAWLNVAFHVGVYALTGSTMGQFFFAGAAASLLLLEAHELPGARLTVLATIALAGPWTHRYAPVVIFLTLLLLRARSALTGPK
ncbi:MAG: hypothetical protein Q8L48_38620 [Archangium sp.]|nr:hypothetical protein [Archangium sp.]